MGQLLRPLAYTNSAFISRKKNNFAVQQGYKKEMGGNFSFMCVIFGVCLWQLLQGKVSSPSVGCQLSESASSCSSEQRSGSSPAASPSSHHLTSSSKAQTATVSVSDIESFQNLNLNQLKVCRSRLSCLLVAWCVTCCVAVWQKMGITLHLMWRAGSGRGWVIYRTPCFVSWTLDFLGIIISNQFQNAASVAHQRDNNLSNHWGLGLANKQKNWCGWKFCSKWVSSKVTKRALQSFNSRHLLSKKRSNSGLQSGTCETRQHWGWWAASHVDRNLQHKPYLTHAMFLTAPKSFTVWGHAATRFPQLGQVMNCAVHKSLHLKRVMPPAHVCMWNTSRNCENWCLSDRLC